MLKKGRPQTRKVLANNLRRLMVDRNWTQAELAERAGIAQKTVSQVINEASAASIETAEALAKAFGLEAWQMLMPPVSTELEKAQEMATLIKQMRNSNDSDREVIVNLVERMTRK